MSDIDRRQYTLGQKALLAYDRDGKPGDHYFHESVVKELVEALATYGEHDHSCLLSQCSAGRPTKDGGYEHMFGDKWYPRGEGPPCTCGLSEVFANYKDMK